MEGHSILCIYSIHSILCVMASEAFYKLATIPWDICSMSEWMLGNIAPVYSYPFNGRHSRKTKNVLQYLWIILRPVGVQCWVLSTFFASLLIVTYITYVWQQELSDEQGQITKRKSCFPPTWASSTQTHAPNHQITGMLQGREREREICQVLCKSLLVIFTKVLRYFKRNLCYRRKQCEYMEI